MKPWDLSDRLGHSSMAFTLNVYRHAIRATQDQAASTAAEFLLGETRPGRSPVEVRALGKAKALAM
jgi:hypothetical protein